MSTHTSSQYVLVIGGRNRADASLRPEWEGSETAVIAIADLGTGEVRTVGEYQSPLEWLPEAAFVSHVFKSSSIDGSELLLSTPTSIMSAKIPSLEISWVHSEPSFNDVHHVVRRENGNLAVANTGLDQIVEFDESMEVVARSGTDTEDPWSGRDPEVDYRLVQSTKPHTNHPNFVAERNGELLVTRFKNNDMVSVHDRSSVCDIPGAAPHDGLEWDGRRYFTSVDGVVSVFDATDDSLLSTAPIGEPGDGVLGWCRGIQPLPDGLAAVAFSRIRKTKFKANVAWVNETVRRVKRAKHRPSRLAIVSVEDGSVLREISTERAGVDTIFSVLPVSDEVGAELLSRRSPVKMSHPAPS